MISAELRDLKQQIEGLERCDPEIDDYSGCPCCASRPVARMKVNNWSGEWIRLSDVLSLFGE